ncbi:MAG: RND family transporter, partial [Pseudomonadota bacterium]
MLGALWRRPFGVGYRSCLRNAHIVQAGMVIACIAALFFIGRFSFDASSDSLVAQGDPELAYFQDMVERFGESEALYVTYTPYEDELFSERHLETLSELQQALEQVQGVREVTSLLDVPLLRSPPVNLTELGE